MASYTPNYSLKKPADADTYDIADANGNMDLIDTALHSQNEAIVRKSATDTDFDNYSVVTGAADGHYYGANISSYTHRPDNENASSPFTFDVYNNGGYIQQKLFVYTSAGVPRVYVRQQYWASGGAHPFGDWICMSNDVIKCNTSVSIPASGSSVTKSIAGLTDLHELVKWNFSSSAENNPPVNLTWTTASGSFTITNNGGATSETIKPVFVLPTLKTAT